jgi:hypothetical protein
VNFDFAGEQNDPLLVAIGTRKHNASSWSGVAGYAAYDWTKALRTVLRLEYRHDQASTKSFSLTNFSTTPTSRAQDTFSIALTYVFF